MNVEKKYKEYFTVVIDLIRRREDAGRRFYGDMGTDKFRDILRQM